MRNGAIRMVMLAVLVSAGLTPCLADAPETAPCPMAGCDKPESASMDATCCCKASEDSAESSPGVFLPRPQPAAAASAGIGGDGVIDPVPVFVPEDEALRSPDPVPLFLLHASLLI